MASSRPSDHIDSPERLVDPTIVQPKLGVVGYLRFFWRQLTSMRTALFLLLLLAFAAIPGSLVPQRSSDPNGVIQFKVDNPDLFPVLDGLQVFSTYTSVWFSSIYLLLFVSLIGCIIPRTNHHIAALRARPPRTPARLGRLAGYTRIETVTDAAAAIDIARAQLKRLGYRTERYGLSVSAERGYLRETGNLVFHTALVGILVSVAIGGSFGYSGQRVVVEGQKFVNVLGDYDSFNPGRFFSSDVLEPYRISLDEFRATYELKNTQAIGQATDYSADVTTSTPGGASKKSTVKVNEPLAIGGTNVFLLGNGYAPTVVVRDPAGTIVWTDSTPFLPQDPKLTSIGVLKIPDGLAEQLGLVGFFYPTAAKLPTGAFTSGFPGLLDPMLSLQVYSGDLGLDAGVPKSVYQLDTDGLTPLAGGKAEADALQLRPGETVALPDGLGTIELTDVKRFASFDIHRDPSQAWVLLFAILILAGLFTGLFIPRRRVWVKATPEADGSVVLEYAGLARGEDPRLESAVADIAAAHMKQLGLKVES
ncbi:MAG: resB [Microbacteriaceae bacterium]|jgi:cytochrome c biogenesis protein|nr:resB [Microbacteriaceae bacterium]